MQNAYIRRAASGDERILAHIQARSWVSAFSEILPEETMARMSDEARIENMYRHVLNDANTHVMLQYVDGKAHGIAGWGEERSGQWIKTAELICIHSMPDRRRCGYGSALITAVLQDMREAGFEEAVLWVFEANVIARRFYEKHGFSATEKRKNSFGAAEMMYKRKL